MFIQRRKGYSVNTIKERVHEGRIKDDETRLHVIQVEDNKAMEAESIEESRRKTSSSMGKLLRW